MAGTAPVIPDSPYQPVYPFNQADEDDLDVARQAQHIIDPALLLSGFTNGLPGYGNACFRNAAVSLLVNTHPISGYIVANTSAGGQLDGNSTARLLENVIREYFSTTVAGKQARLDMAIQRLYNRVNYQKPIDTTKTTKLLRRYAPSTQQDALEMLVFMLEDILFDFPGARVGSRVQNSFTTLFQTTLAAETRCTVCGRGTDLAPNPNEEDRSALRAALSPSITTFDELIATAFNESLQPAFCKVCNKRSPRSTEWKILKPSEVVFVGIDQISLAGTKLGRKVPDIPEILNLDSHIHDVAVVNGITARYRLIGIINHRGVNNLAGHYVSHIRDLSGAWHLLDDAQVSSSSLLNAQKYDPTKKAGQMLPHTLAYVRIHDHVDDSSLATRAKTVDVAPTPFIHEQIFHDDTMGLKALRDVCNQAKFPPTKEAKIPALRALIDKANSRNTTFGTRPRDWLIDQLTKAGERVDLPALKPALSEQMRNFMTSQPLPIASVPFGPSTSGNPTDAATQAALDAAKQRITDLEAALAAATTTTTTRNPTTTTGTGPRSPGPVTTDQIRELIRRLPASPVPSPRLGDKRPASGPAALSSEREKRRAIRLADDACTAIDAGARLAPARTTAGGRQGSDSENQRPDCSNNVTQTPGSGARDPNQRCHRCPIIAGEIHHMHANACGWVPGRRVSAPTSSEVRDHRQQGQGVPTRSGSTQSFHSAIDVSALNGSNGNNNNDNNANNANGNESGIVVEEGEMTDLLGAGTQPQRQPGSRPTPEDIDFIRLSPGDSRDAMQGILGGGPRLADLTEDEARGRVQGLLDMLQESYKNDPLA